MRPVNLLPDAHRPAAASGARGGIAYYVLGALGAVLVAALLYTFTAGQVTSREDEAAQVAAQAAEAEAEAQALAPFGDFRMVKETRVASVGALAQARIDWERLTREVARVLPKSSYLTSLEGSTTGEGSEGSDAPAASADGTPEGPSVVLTGCAESQPSVARMLVRLRRLNGAEDVTLEESVKNTTGGIDAASSAGTGGCFGDEFGFNATVLLAEPSLQATGTDTDVNIPAALGGGS